MLSHFHRISDVYRIAAKMLWIYYLVGVSLSGNPDSNPGSLLIQVRHLGGGWRSLSLAEWYDECCSESANDVVVVKTSLGDIRGRVVSAPLGGVTDVTVDQYLGIPFAVPPVGQLRFADPVPLDRLPSGTLTPRLHLTSLLCCIVWHDLIVITVSKPINL